MITGTIKNAVKLQVLDNKWQQKKKDINSQKPTKELTQEERMIADFKDQVERERESNAHADLYNKLKTGGKLTSEEISYLEQNDPEALRKYREAQAERASYERQLKNCKTKDEVERVKMNKMGNFVTQARNITNDPYIPLDKKLELMNQLNDKVCRINEAHMEFVDSKQYKDMPTEGELSEERTEESRERAEDMQEAVSESVNEDEEADTTEEILPKENEVTTEMLKDSNVSDSKEKNDISESIREMAEDNEKEAENGRQKVRKENSGIKEETAANRNADDFSDFASLKSYINRFLASADNRKGSIDISL